MKRVVSCSHHSAVLRSFQWAWRLAGEAPNCSAKRLSGRVMIHSSSLTPCALGTSSILPQSLTSLICPACQSLLFSLSFLLLLLFSLAPLPRSLPLPRPTSNKPPEHVLRVSAIVSPRGCNSTGLAYLGGRE